MPRFTRIALLLVMICSMLPVPQAHRADAAQTSDVAIFTKENGQPAYDACYLLVGFSLEGCDENQDGRVMFADIPHGDYTVRQTADLGPGRSVDDFTIEVIGNINSAGFESFSATILNSTGSPPITNSSGQSDAVDIALITRDPENGDLLTGACYILVDYSLEGCDENGDGQVTFAAIPFGAYTVRQTRTPAGYPTINDYDIAVEPVEGMPGGGSFGVPLGFIVKQAPNQNAPGTRNVSVVLIDMATQEKLAVGACVQLVGASLVGCDEDLVDGQIDFLDVPAGGPYELSFSNLPAGYEVATVGGPLSAIIDADSGTPANQMVFVLLVDRNDSGGIEPSEPSQVVGEDGFTLSLDGVTVSGAADVAPVGAAIRVRLDSQDLPEEVNEFAEPVGTGVDITLGDGLQPMSPLTITFAPEEVSEWYVAAESGDDLVPVVFASKPDGLGAELADAQLLPDGSVVVTADHLSWFQPALVSISDFANWTGEQVAVFLQVRSDKPDCVDQSVENGVWQISAIPHQVIWPCVQQTGDNVKVTLTNNSPEVWLVTSEQATPGYPFVLSPVDAIVAAIILQGIDKATTSPLMPPDGSVTFTASGVEDEIVLNATLSAPLTIINAVVTALLIFANGRLIDDLSRADCFINIVSSAIDIATTPDEEAFTDVDAGNLASTVAGCIGTTLGLLGAALGGAIYSAIADAPGALLANIEGAYLTATGDASFPITVSKLDSASAEPEESGSSASAWPTDRNDGPPALYTWIGASSVWPDTGISGMPDWVACDNASDYCLLGYNGEDHVLVQIDGFDIIGTIADWYADPKDALLYLGMTEEVADQILGI